MNYCMECGTKLEERELPGEGIVPYCPTCAAYRFPVFSTAVIMIAMTADKKRILLIKQYGGSQYILVAGYVNKGESAEHAVCREVKEETGLDVVSVQYNKSEYFPKSNALMLNFTCYVADDCLDGMTAEVDEAAWFPVEEARANIWDGSLAQKFLEHFVTNNL